MKARVKGGRPSVLLVDDVEANLVALEAELAKLPCEPVRASSGDEALRWLLKREFAAMLLDVQMPDMDGYEVATYARNNPSTSDVPIIFVTAMHETEDNAVRGYGAGAVDFLFKPFNPEILRSKVRVFLELYLGRQRLADEIDAHRQTMSELEAFNYSVSHDLRAPLRPLDGFSQALLEDYGEILDDNAKDYLLRIRAAAQRMSQLIEDMLRLSRTGRAEMNVRSVDLSVIAGQVVAELRRGDGAREVELVLPPKLEVQGDGRLLRVALENLLSNAWKFTQRTHPARVELGVTEHAGKPAFFVRDNGAGFDPALAHKLFHPFQRLHAVTDFDGTGIGLAIVQRIIRRHGGRVWAEGAPGHGATFYFTLHEREAT